MAGIIKEGLEKIKTKIDLLIAETEITKEKIELLKKDFDHFDNKVGNLIGEETQVIKRPREIRNGRKDGLDDFLSDVIIRNKKDLLETGPIPCDLNNAEKLQYLLFKDVATHKKENSLKEMFQVKYSQMVSSDRAFSNSLRDNRRKKYAVVKRLFGTKNLLFERKYNELLNIIIK